MNIKKEFDDGDDPNNVGGGRTSKTRRPYPGTTERKIGPGIIHNKITRSAWPTEVEALSLSEQLTHGQDLTYKAKRTLPLSLSFICM
jgi:hypothetical protein